MALVLCAGVVVLQMILALPFEIVGQGAAAIAKSEPIHLSQHPFVLGIVNLLAIGGVLAGGAFWARAPWRFLFPLRAFRPVLMLPVVISTGGAIIVLSEVDNLFRRAFPVPTWLSEVFQFFTAMGDHPMSAFFTLVIVAPVTEELLFRGLILRGFLARYRLETALVLSSLLFALTHLNPWQFCSAATIGVVFAWWRARTGSLWPGLIGHALGNSLVVWHRALPFEIEGFNRGDPLTQTGLQPLWFDALGLALFVSGLWLFYRWQPPLKCPPVIPQPPVILNV